MLNKKNIIKAVFILLIILLAGSCYQMNETSSGDLALNATLPAAAKLFGDTDEVWVVGLVVDSAYEDKLIEMMRLYDKNDYTDIDSFEDDADEILEDMLQKGAVRFDGGRFFFQFKMTSDGSDTGDFLISGIPADKKYFLYLQIFDNEITSIDDMEDQDADVYMEMHYFDPAYYTGGYPAGLSGVSKGWYYFEDWDPDYTDDINNPDLYADVWIPVSSPVSNQPFLVEPGKETALDILLIEDPED